MTIQEASQKALDIQDACNLGGVVLAFHDVIEAVWDEANRQKKGTDWVNRHPICVLFADKIEQLTGKTNTTTNDAYRLVIAMARGEGISI